MGLKSKYNRVGTWESTQKEMLDTIRAANVREFSITVPSGLQHVETFGTEQTFNCSTHLKSAMGSMFVTQVCVGKTNPLLAWTYKMDLQKQEVIRFDIPFTVKQLLFVKKYRIYVTYCSDMKLRLFTDFQQNFKLLLTTSCKYTILCMAFNNDRDELVIGGAGCLLRFSLKDYRNKLKRLEGYHIPIKRNELVLRLMIDYKAKQMMIHLDNGIFVIDYLTSSIIHKFVNPHTGALSCIVFDPPRDYMITSGRDGSIKVWSKTVFSQLHQFFGHYQEVTDLMVYKKDPLLLSSSLDRTIRVWRLDTLELQHRLDIGDHISRMQLIDSEHLVYFTDSKIKIWSINMFHHMFSSIQTGAIRLQLSTHKSKHNRVVCSADDGSILIMSPLTGESLTMVYPLSSMRALTDTVYDRREDYLYSVLDGEVLVFDCNTNPCRPLYKLKADEVDQNIECICIINMDLALGWKRAKSSEPLLFAGHADGTISLIHATTTWMKKPAKAHFAPVIMLEASHLRPSAVSQSSVGRTQRLISVGADLLVRVWEVIYDDVVGDIVLNTLIAFETADIPSYICMLGDTFCYNMYNTRILHMIRLNPARIMPLEHHIDEDHDGPINGLDCCPELELFASTGNGGILKIWNIDNQLIRELTFDESLRSVCFINARGDIIVGFQNHLHVVPIANYLPVYMLERLVIRDFKDDVREEAIPFNHSQQIGLSCHYLTTFSIDLKKRKRQLKEYWQEKESIEKYTKYYQKRRAILHEKLEELVSSRAESVRSSTQPTPDLEHRKSSEPPLTGSSANKILNQALASVTEADEKVQDTTSNINIPDSSTTELTSKVSVAVSVDSGQGGSEEDSVISYSDQEEEDGESMKVKGATKSGTKKRGAKQRRSSLQKNRPQPKDEDQKPPEEPVPTEEELEAERKKKEEEEERRREERRKMFPIAPDGYIPNSAVRGVMKFKAPEPPQKIEPWRLKPAPALVAKYLADDSQSETASETSMSQPMVFDYDESEPEELTQEPEHVEPVVVKPPEPKKQEKKQLEKYQLKKLEIPKVDMDNDIWKKKQNLKMPKTSNSLPEDEEGAGGSDEQKEDSKEELEHELIRRICGQKWFPKNVKRNLNGIISAFIAIMDNMHIMAHKAICDYIIELYKTFGFTSFLLNKVIDKLMLTLGNENGIFRAHAAKCLGELGVPRKEVLMGLLPLLVDEEEVPKREAREALKKLTGVETKDDLLKMLEDVGVLSKSKSSKDDEDMALAQLAEKMATEEDRRVDPADISNRIDKWITETPVPGEDDEEEEEEEESQEDVFQEQFTKKSPRTIRPKPKATQPVQDDKPRKPHVSKVRKIPNSTYKGVQMPDKKEEIQPGFSYEQPRQNIRGKKDLCPTNPDLYKMYNKQATSIADTASVSDGQSTSRSIESGRGHKEQLKHDKPEPRIQTEQIKHERRKLRKSTDVYGSKDSVGKQHRSADTTVDQDLESDVHSTSYVMDEDDSGQTSYRGADDSGFSESEAGKYDRSLVSRGMPHLSPVKSQVDESDPMDGVPDNWRDFFNRPEAQERRRQAEARDNAGKLQPITLPPIQYIAEDTPLVPADPGVRLLQSVGFAKPMTDSIISDGSSGSGRRHLADPLHRGNHNIQYGNSKFGVLNMHWTTGVPSSEGKRKPPPDEYKPQHMLHGQQPHYIQPFSEKHQVERQNTHASSHLPSISHDHHHNGPKKQSPYGWEEPLPPPPDNAVRKTESGGRHEHGHYCDYYRLLKKRMHDHCSSSGPLPLIPNPSNVKVILEDDPRLQSHRKWSMKKGLSQLTLQMLIGSS